MDVRTAPLQGPDPAECDKGLALEAEGTVEMPMLCGEHREYRVYFATGIFSKDKGLLRQLLKNRGIFVVTTPSVDRLFGEKFRGYLDHHGLHAVYTVVTCTEATKTFDTVTHICRLAQAAKLDRRAVLISFGGGACCDIVSFAASIIRRGITHIRLPTTLIGQVDAGIAVKSAVNFGAVKNYLGCFFPPSAVIVDPEFLHTLQDFAIRHGLSEIIKMTILKDAELFNSVERNCEALIESRFARPAIVRSTIIQRSIALMLHELQQNPYETKSFERWVDFGHTFSPQLEAASGFTLPHGEAVAIDMALSSVIAAEMGLLSSMDLNRILALLMQIGLPIYCQMLTPELCDRAVDGANLHRGGNINLVVPTSIGQATFIRNKSDFPRGLLTGSVNELAKRVH